MKYYGIDIETHDPLLTDRGASWVYGEGSILCTGIYDAATGKKRALPGGGGAAVKKMLLDKNTTLIGANTGYDLGWLCHEHGIKAEDMKCSVVDVETAEACIDEYQPYSLEALAMKYLGEHKGSDPLAAWAEGKGLRGDFRRHLKQAWEEVPEMVKEYVVSDADQPVRIWERQKKILEETSGMEATGINFKLIRITLGMKQRGVRLDMAKRKKNAKVLQKVWDEKWPSFEQKYGKVNVNSPKQLSELFIRERVPVTNRITIKGYIGQWPFTGGEIWEARNNLRNKVNGLRIEKRKLVLYVPYRYAARTAAELEDMGLSVINNPSLDKKRLEFLKMGHTVVAEVLDLKLLKFTLENFFGANFERFIVKHGEKNYRIHPDFNIVGARQTGRFSSSNPNGQNIPSRTVLFAETENEIEVFKLCREVFIPDDGMLIGKLDFSGQENRLMAHFAVGKGGKFIRAQYNRNPDFDEHDLVGEESGLYEKYGKKVGRKYIKNYRFGKAYGMKVPTMMSYFGWDKEHAEHMDKVFDESAPWVRDTMDKASEIILDRGYVITVAGRRCHLERSNGVPVSWLAYTGFNKLIQGSGSDLMKKAMVELDEEGLLDTFTLYLTVHDEIVIGVPKTKAALKRLPRVQNIMENTYPLSVPMRVDPEIGPDWCHVEKYSGDTAS